MKHPSSREFFAYWNEQRAHAPAPDRSDIKPEPIRHLLGDIFVLSYDPICSLFRVAGTRVCALLGRDVKHESFAKLFSGIDRRKIDDLLGITAEETLATVAGVTARAADGTPVHLELLLLPFSTRPHTPPSLTGMLISLNHHHSAMTDFTITSWRHIRPEQQSFVPRTLRKLSVARGLMSYEGLY